MQAGDGRFYLCFFLFFYPAKGGRMRWRALSRGIKGRALLKTVHISFMHNFLTRLPAFQLLFSLNERADEDCN